MISGLAMRELIFNEASTAVLFPSLHQAQDALICLARGMAVLIQSGYVHSVFRARHHLYEIGIATDGTLLDCLLQMQRSRTGREESRLWMSLAYKAPLLTELPPDVVDRFQRCEPAAPESELGAALVLCAHLGAVAVSLRTEAGWDVDELIVEFIELLSDSTIVEVLEKVDNLARRTHAQTILARYRASALDQLTHATFWGNRRLVFPNLSFGLDVEEQVAVVGSDAFATIVRRLAELNAAAGQWITTGGPAPNWPCKVSPESQTTMNNEQLRRARVFRGPDGTARLYEWHARFGAVGRIHLGFNAATRTVEIGYIGSHLPLA
jgi:hypothetical protein